MRNWILGLAVVVLGTSMAQADEKATEAVKKAIEAHGGAATLDKYKAGKFDMKGEISMLGMDFEFTGKLAYVTPDRYRLEMEASIMGMKLNIQQVVKGASAKSKVSVGGMVVPVPDEEKDELKLSAALQEAEQLTPLLDPKKFEIKHVGEEDVGGSKATAITVKVKALDKEAKFWFDNKSNLLVKTAHKSKGPGDDGQPKEVLAETIHGEYKKINGVQVAHKLTVTHDGKKFMTVNAKDVQLLEKLDDKEFPLDD